MHTVLIYDISSDSARAKVADACLDYGLKRIQYSGFFGNISANHLEELLRRIKRLVEKTDASIDVFPICEKDLRLRRTLITKRLQLPPRPGRKAAQQRERVQPALEPGTALCPGEQDP